MSKIAIISIWLMTHFSLGSFSQSNTSQTVETAQFNTYLNFILSQQQDSLPKINTEAIYKIHYKSTCSFNDWINDKNYIDSGQRICIQNMRKVSDSIQFSSNEIENMQLVHNGLKHKSMQLIFSSSGKNPVSQDPFGGEKYRSFASFDNGRYVILGERTVGPDIRSSMPPGYDVTYLLEIKE